MNIAITITRSSWIYTLHLAPAPGGTIYAHLRDRYAKREGAILALAVALPSLRDATSIDAAIAHADELYRALAATIHEPETNSPHSQRPRHPTPTG